MKIKFYLLVCSCFAYNIVHSQTLKVYNGLSFSSNSSEIGVLTDNSLGYTGMLGIDYQKSKYYFLSSALGFVSKGGKNHIFVAEENGFAEQDIRINWSYLHINTTFRVKTPSNKFYAYLGVGPKIEILLDSSYKQRNDGYDIKLSPVLWGIVGEAGIVKKVRKIELGLSALYNLNFNDFGNSKNGNTNAYTYALDNHNFLITFSVGLDL